MKTALMVFLLCAGVLLTLVLATCASLPFVRPQDRPVSYALAEPRATSLGQLLDPHVDAHAGESGFSLVASGREAFMARYALALVAEHTIDVQYYIWESDMTGRILLAALIKAADRGVRVRILLD